MTSERSEPLQYFLEVIFVQGWPDNNQLWDTLKWKEQLSDHRLLFINFPNTTPTQKIIKWGQDFDVIADRLYATIEQVSKQGKFVTKTLVCHDWGCHYSYLLDQRYPGYLTQLIALDVPAYVELIGLFAKLYVIFYQTTLIIAFLLGGLPGKLLTNFIMKINKYSPKYKQTISGVNNYPYFYFHKRLYLHPFDKTKRLLYGYKPSVPIVYLYGKTKPFQFHGQKWLEYLRSNPGCEIHGVESGHWIMNKFPKFITDLISRRVLKK